MATIKNDRDAILQAASVRIVDTAANIDLSAGTFNTAKNGGATSPSSITLTAVVTAFTVASVKTWYWASNIAPDTWTLIGTGNNITVSNSTFITNVGTGSAIQYKVIVTEFGFTDAVGYNTISYIKQGDDPMFATLITNADFPAASSAGVVTTLPSGNFIKLWQGSTQITSGVTFAGTATKNGLTVTVNSSTGALTVTQTSWTSSTESFALTATYNSIAYPITYVITKVIEGASGTGNKYVTINAFRWSNAGSGTYTQAFTYTWSTGGVSAYPSGWTATAPASPGTGYTLYQLNLTVSDIGVATTTSANWNAASVNSIGYRQDGSIGVQGNDHKACYALYNSGGLSFSGSTTSSGSSSVPSGVWTTGQLTAFTQTVQTPTTGQALYQCDGVYSNITGNITWQAPYLSNFKVGSLSAISSDMGYITAGDIQVGSSPAVSGTSMTGYGTHLYGNGNFCLGTPTRNIGYNGSNLFINGFMQNASSGVTTVVSYNGAAVTNISGNIYLGSITPIKGSILLTISGRLSIHTANTGSIFKAIKATSNIVGGINSIGSGIQTADAQYYYFPFSMTQLFTPGAGVTYNIYYGYFVESFQYYVGGSYMASIDRVEVQYSFAAHEII